MQFRPIPSGGIQPSRKLVARIKGGIGNQLFCYAAARRLAMVNNAELVIDDVTGFARDRRYHRQYALDRFQISARKATPSERLEPFERYRRGVMKWVSRKQPFAARRYIEQEPLDFDERLLRFKINGAIYLDGLWASEGYFKDVEPTIREDLRIIPPKDTLNQRTAEEIRHSNSVSLHVRWFDTPGNSQNKDALVDYYQRAIALIETKLESPRYFLFSDNPDATKGLIPLCDSVARYISHNVGDENAHADLWLMTQCRHFITTQSTFSWWGAWLGGTNEKIVVSRKLKSPEHTMDHPNISPHVPSDWLEI